MTTDKHTRLTTAGELMTFFAQNKWYWLAPMLGLLLALGVLLVFAESAGVSALIYSLF
jgi:uncharacterized protein DUF5989